MKSCEGLAGIDSLEMDMVIFECVTRLSRSDPDGKVLVRGAHFWKPRHQN